jgi:hypothetical protein
LEGIFIIFHVMSDRHEQFAGKNAALGRVWGMDAKDKEKAKEKERGPAVQKVGKCEKCGLEKPLRSYRVQMHDRTEGTASYGIAYKLLCDECKPAAKPHKEVVVVSDKAIKAMLRGARKGL